MNEFHRSVLLKESINGLSIKPNGIYIDATFGGGGYSKHLLENHKINNLIAIDRDPITSIFANNLKKKFKNFKLINGKFSQIDFLLNCEN